MRLILSFLLLLLMAACASTSNLEHTAASESGIVHTAHTTQIRFSKLGLTISVPRAPSPNAYWPYAFVSGEGSTWYRVGFKGSSLSPHVLATALTELDSDLLAFGSLEGMMRHYTIPRMIRWIAGGGDTGVSSEVLSIGEERSVLMGGIPTTLVTVRYAVTGRDGKIRKRKSYFFWLQPKANLNLWGFMYSFSPNPEVVDGGIQKLIDKLQLVVVES